MNRGTYNYWKLIWHNVDLKLLNGYCSHCSTVFQTQCFEEVFECQKSNFWPIFLKYSTISTYYILFVYQISGHSKDCFVRLSFWKFWKILWQNAFYTMKVPFTHFSHGGSVHELNPIWNVKFLCNKPIIVHKTEIVPYSLVNV